MSRLRDRDAFAVAAWAFTLASYARGLLGALCAVAGTCVLALGVWRGAAVTRPVDARGGGPGPWLVLQLAVMGVVRPRPGGLGSRAEVPGAVAWCAVGALVSAVLLWAMLRPGSGPAGFPRRSPGLWRGLAASAVVGLLVTGGAMIISAGGEGDDVLHVHEQAAAAIADGRSPYGPAVNVKDHSPLAAPGDRIIGYVYPPLAAVAYALGTWTLGDPRWTSLFAIAVLLALLGRRAALGNDASSPSLLSAILLLAAIPAWPRVLEESWTEPLSLLLLGLSALAWNRPVASSIALGLAFASKQYFILAAPCAAIALLRGSRGKLRLGVTLATTVATTAPIIIDWRGFYGSAVELLINLPPRPDSVGLGRIAREMGLPWPPHTGGLAVVVCWLCAVVLARRRGAPAGEPWSTIALVMAVGFLLMQSFANYWYLAAGLCALAAFAAERRGEASARSVP
jgi:hypothetical protein